MMLPFTSGLIETKRTDPECAALADRHYSRQTVGHREFVGPAKNLILRNAEGTVLFVWMFPRPEYRMDGQLGFNCTLFRNESKRRSSEIILEAERFAVAKWGPGRAYTYVDKSKVKSRNPGWCFIAAGWRVCGESKKGKRILEKELR